MLYKITPTLKQSFITFVGFFDYKGQRKSLAEYTYEKYKIAIVGRNPPIIISNPTKRDRNAGRDTDVKLIPEVCFLTGQTDDMRADNRFQMVNIG